MSSQLVARPLRLDEEMCEQITRASAEGSPIIVATTDRCGQPSLGYYSTVYAYSDYQLALWVGDPCADVLTRLALNPYVALLYRSAANGASWHLQGRARVVVDVDERARVWSGVPASEKRWDPTVLGRAVIVDLDRVLGRGVLMER
jgi:hypothetical protein